MTTPPKIRLALTGSVTPTGLGQISLTRGDEADLQLCLKNADGTLVDISTLVDLTLEIYENSTAATQVSTPITLPSSSFNTALTLSQWNLGTHQHATFNLTSAQTNIPTETRQLTVWAVIYGTLSDGGRRTFGAGTLTILSGNAGGDPPLEALDPLYPTLSQVAPLLLPSGVTPGTYGSTTQVPILTVNANGRLTSVTIATISAGGSDPLKANIDSPTFTGTVGGITAAMVGLGNVNNTSDTAKPVSTAQQTALDLKANLASPTFTGTVSGITAAMVGLGAGDSPTFAGIAGSTGGVFAPLLQTTISGILSASLTGFTAQRHFTFGVYGAGSPNNGASTTSTGAYAWTSSGTDSNGTRDLLLFRDAAGILAQRNGTNKQISRVYNTFSATTATNEWGGFDWQTNTNTLRIGTEHGGSGSPRAIDFVIGGTPKLSISTTGDTSTAGNFSLPNGSFRIGWSGRSQIGSSSNGLIALYNSTVTDFDRLQFGGTTLNFPALKRSTTTLEARLADDSGYAAVQTLYDRFGAGTPEGAVSAPVGALYHRTDGSTGTSLYLKETGSTGNTGWVPIS